MSGRISHRRLLPPLILIQLAIFGGLTAIALSLMAAVPAFAAGIVVNSSADTVSVGDGVCTLREAIANANTDSDTTGGDCPAGSGDDVIGFAPALVNQTITLSGTELTINNNLSLNGPGANQLAISGGNASRVFSVTTGIVAISGLTIRDGHISSAHGSGIYNSGTLTLDHVAVVSNTISAGNITDGGGIYNRGTLTVTHSAIISNTNLGSNGRGGGVAVGAGRVSIINSTISHNTANSTGGGIINTATGVLTTVNASVVHNRAVSFWGGGIYAEAPANLKNSLIANNTDNSGARDCYYLFIAPTSLGYNLVENRGNCSFSAGGDITGQEPKIGPLGDNGGPTLSHALLAGSPANDKIPSGSSGCGHTTTTDQRDYLRLQGRACSIGAVEYNGIWLTLNKKVDDDTPDPNQAITYTLLISLAPSGNVSVTNVLLTDSLPTGINFVGPTTLTGGSGGQSGPPPILASGSTITGGNVVSVTVPVTVSIGIKGETVITNSGTVSSTEVVVPINGSVVVTVNNVAPVAIDDTPTVLEDSSANNFTVKSNDYDLNWDNFTLSAVGPTSSGGSTTSMGQTISYTPTQGFNGTESFTYTITDGEFTTAAAVTVTVTSINDAPSFNPGADQWLLQGAGAQTVTGWASSLSAGPSNESSQTLSFTLQAGTPALFASQPAIDPAGDLTFAPNPTMTGTTTVTATLQDNGGTANGGSDSFTQTFTITIVAGDEQGTVAPSTGGTLAYVDAGRGVSTTVQSPAGSVTGTIQLVYDELAATQYSPPPGYNFAGRIFALQIYSGTTPQPGYTFKSPITLTFTYNPNPEVLNHADETTLDLRRWNGSAWVSDGFALVEFDQTTHRFVATTNRPGKFALIGNAARLVMSKAVSDQGKTPAPGSTIIYTLAVSNSGALTATGVVITDALPTGLSFGSWVEQNGATFNLATNTVGWGPSLIPAFSPVLIQFRAIITTANAYTSTVITNTAEFKSDNGGFGANKAAFSTSAKAVEGIYLPLILEQF